MRGRHRFGIRVEQEAGQHARLDRRAALAPLDPMFLELTLHLGPELLLDDRRMFAGKGLVLVDGLSAIERILQHQIQRPARKPLAAIGTAVGRHASLAHEAAGRQIVSQGTHRPEFEIAPKDRPHGRRFRLVDDELALLHVVTEPALSAHPNAFFLRSGDLVADSLPGDLALELREGQQHVEREPPHAAGRIEGLSDGDERDALGVEGLDDLGEVR